MIEKRYETHHKPSVTVGNDCGAVRLAEARYFRLFALGLDVERIVILM